MDLLDYLDTVQDPRNGKGIRHSVGLLLKIALLALLSGITCIEHMGVYAAQHWKELAEPLGYQHWHAPDGETFRLLFSKLDSRLFSDIFEKWLSNRLKNKVFDAAIDGKACRGVINPNKPAGKGLEILNVFAHDLEVVLAQWPLGNKKGELTVVKANLEGLIQKYPGLRLLTGDAGLSGRNLCETVIKYRKDYLVRIKGNQPDVEEALLFWFEERLKRNSKPDARSVEKKRSRYNPCVISV